MAWPTKTDFVDGDVLTAAQVNNIGTNLNIFNPTSATNGQVLTANGSGSASYQSLPASGGWTSLASGNLSGLSSLDLQNISQAYKNLHLVLVDWSLSANNQLNFRYNNITGSNYYGYYQANAGAGFLNLNINAQTSAQLLHASAEGTGVDNFTHVEIVNYTNTTAQKLWYSESRYQYVGNIAVGFGQFYYQGDVTAVSRVTVFPTTGTFDNGTYILYGEN